MKRIVLALIVLALLSGAVWWYLNSQPVVATDAIVASGTIEAEEVAITAEVGGRVVEVLADEGDEVEKDAVLVELDRDLLLARIEEARAAVEAARANLAQVKVGARPEEIRVAEAALAQAIAARDGARRAWEDAKALRDNPQELDAQIDEARTQLALAEQSVEQARAELATAKVQRDQYKAPSSEYYAHDRLVQAAEAALRAAEATRDGARKALENLLAMRENPLELEARVNAARAQLEQAEAAVAVAQADLDALRAGPTEEQIAVAQAQVRQAEAALEVLQVQLDKMTLRSPLAGLVTSRAINVGETAAPGATLLTVADLDEVTLTLYVPETQIGRVKVGQEVEVQVDSYPDRVFKGRVVHISSRAEFTPRNVQTREERVNMVFAVKVALPNPGHELKPGMPADARILTEEVFP
ncbi:MAG TPA: HlyD family efflux transporter periplasmic adaptor subunit [Anaerolineae bacterium]|nr:HlyD family efflux transporter periplasmic adaptor subunit [Anaerolineae bacterium]